MDGERVVDPKVKLDECADAPFPLLAVEALEYQDVALCRRATEARPASARIRACQRDADRSAKSRIVSLRRGSDAVRDLPFLHWYVRVRA